MEESCSSVGLKYKAQNQTIWGLSNMSECKQSRAQVPLAIHGVTFLKYLNVNSVAHQFYGVSKELNN